MQQTSLSAYQEMRYDGTLGKQESEVLSCLQVMREANITMIAKRLGMEKSTVSGRIGDLREKGMIIESYKDICPFTKKRTIFWRVR